MFIKSEKSEKKYSFKDNDMFFIDPTGSGTTDVTGMALIKRWGYTEYYIGIKLNMNESNQKATQNKETQLGAR